MSTHLDEILRLVAAHGLVATPGAPRSLEGDLATAVLEHARAHRLVGLLDQTVAEGALVCEPATADHVGAVAVDAAAWELLVERHLLAVHHTLDREGLPHRFLKGATSAHRFYAHPGLRMFVDLDLLVPDDRFDDAVQAIAATGHERVQPDPYPGFSSRYAKAVTLHRPDGLEVDLHRSIADGPFGLRGSTDPLWERSADDVALGGRRVPALDVVASFVVACTNTVTTYDRVSWGALREVAQVGERIASAVPDVQALAGALRLEACAADAVRRAMTDLRWSPPDAVAEIATWPVSRRERQWLDSYQRRPTDLRRTLLGMHAVPGATRKAAYLASAARLLVSRPARRRQRAGR